MSEFVIQSIDCIQEVKEEVVDETEESAPVDTGSDDNLDFHFMSDLLHTTNDTTDHTIDDNVFTIKTEESIDEDLEPAVITAEPMDDPTEADLAEKTPRLDNDQNLGQSGQTKTTTITKVLVESSPPKTVQTPANKLWICPFTDCLMEFRNKDQLYQHLTVVHHLLSCSNCDMKFASEEMLQKHMKVHKGKLTPVKSRPKPTVRPLIPHIRIRRVGRPALPTVPQVAQVPRAIRSVALAGQPIRFPAPVLTTFRPRSAGARTIYLVPGTNLAMFRTGNPTVQQVVAQPNQDDNICVCNTCGQSFDSEARLESHQEFFDERRITLKNLICFKCHKMFQGQHLIDQHMATMHNNDNT